MAYKGKWKPTNPHKYNGDVNKIVYRSLWERQVMVKLDNDPTVEMWSSEGLAIKYISPKDGRCHKYWPDFLVKWTNGEFHIIEIKPKKQCSPPNPKRKKTRSFLRETVAYCVNQAKWRAAIAYCAEYSKYHFKVYTEDHRWIKVSKRVKRSKN